MSFDFQCGDAFSARRISMNILDSEIVLHNPRRAYHSPSLNFKLALDIPSSDNQGMLRNEKSRLTPSYREHPENLNEVNVSCRRRCESQHCRNTKAMR